MGPGGEPRIFWFLTLGIMEEKMETTIVYWGYMGTMEKKMEATIHDDNFIFLVGLDL